MSVWGLVLSSARSGGTVHECVQAPGVRVIRVGVGIMLDEWWPMACTYVARYIVCRDMWRCSTAIVRLLLLAGVRPVGGPMAAVWLYVCSAVVRLVSGHGEVHMRSPLCMMLGCGMWGLGN